MDGETLTLTNGPLRFTAQSLGDGPLVLCLHGFPDNAASFRCQLPLLAESGYRAVSVTLRGYEPGSQPADGDYSLAALAGDVIVWLDQLQVASAHLIGHDWGAAIAYTAGAAAPERFRSLTTIAVPHAGRFVNEAIRFPRQLALSWYMGFFQLRGLAEHVVARNDFQFIRRLWRDWSPGWAVPDGVLDAVIGTLRQPGVTKAALAYYRAALAPRSFTPAARAAARFQVPVRTMAITGDRDGCIDSRVFERLMYPGDFPGGLRLERIHEAGHFVHQERPEVVNPLIREWLEQ